jgi:formylglycine-generating enzyme required for sulfatase activity
MHGNVWEWVDDCYYKQYGPPTGDCRYRVIRGGSWSDDPRLLRSALRGGWAHGDNDNDLGFRVARTLGP